MKTLAWASAIVLLTSPAFAWDNTMNSSHSQIVDGGPGALANGGHAHAHASATGGAGGAGGHGGNAHVVNNVSGGGAGGGGGNVVGVPSVTTANPCGGGISIGGFGIGGGGAGGALWELHDCRLRQAAVLLDARGDHAAARNVWCQISEVRVAYKQAGEPCPEDAPRVQPVAAAPVTQAYALPDWCPTTNGKDPAADRDVCLRALNDDIVHLRNMR